MKWILLVMICWGSNCQTIYEKHLYPSQDECLVQAEIVKNYATETYPNSTGQVWCLTEGEFGNWLKSNSGSSI